MLGFQPRPQPLWSKSGVTSQYIWQTSWGIHPDFAQGLYVSETPRPFVATSQPPCYFKLGFQMCSPLTPHLLTLPIYMHCFWNWHLSDGHLQSCVTFRSTFYMYWRLSDRSCENNNNKKNKIRCNSNLSLKTIIKMSAKCEEEKACDCISWMFRLLCTNIIIYKCMFFVLVFYC